MLHTNVNFLFLTNILLFFKKKIQDKKIYIFTKNKHFILQTIKSIHSRNFKLLHKYNNANRCFIK